MGIWLALFMLLNLYAIILLRLYLMLMFFCLMSFLFISFCSLSMRGKPKVYVLFMLFYGVFGLRKMSWFSKFYLIFQIYYWIQLFLCFFLYCNDLMSVFALYSALCVVFLFRMRNIHLFSPQLFFFYRILKDLVDPCRLDRTL